MGVSLFTDDPGTLRREHDIQSERLTLLPKRASRQQQEPNYDDF
ncbi:hypothetical protein [Halomonas daqiaonensis]|uniref:Uncharacterized protein n=1 Tax=Halomonas daqiaonensis TaxID=650850 RepID=A0A1H7W786_9GAMM|nr:hypothetical protein [Halomonas daqiaonensis]SEM17350.1 hypothetical protein SAMN04488129_13013 [Halomonas daqiaonensis]